MNEDCNDFTDRRLSDLVVCLSETDLTEEQIISVSLAVLPDKSLCGSLIRSLCVKRMRGRDVMEFLGQI